MKKTKQHDSLGYTSNTATFRTSIRSLWEWFPSSLRRLYHIKFLSAVIICLPAILLIAWYFFSAYSSYKRYNISINSDKQLSLELFHIHLHDSITEHIRQFSIPSPPEKNKVPVYNLIVDPGKLSNMYDIFLNERKKPYITGKIKSKGNPVEVELRYRGTKHWHWNYPQKSLKFRLKEKKLFEETRQFNIINEVTPLGIGEKVIMDISRKLNILTPEYKPVRFQINAKHMGLYYFLAQPDEFLLRKSKRIPGSIFSGNKAPSDKKTGISLLFNKTKYWKKTASYRGASSKEMGELEHLLKMINNAEYSDFLNFYKHEIDKQSFARYEALDIIFGSDQHDFNQNHKIYFDPYKGKFEPISWNFRGWKHRRRFNLEQNPLRIRLNLIPEYVALRNKTIYNLLLEKCNIGSLRKRIKKVLKNIAGELISDPFWDAYNLLPDSSSYLRRMVRPMNKERQVLAIHSSLKTMSQRISYLLGKLERTAFTLNVGIPSDNITPVLVNISDISGYKIDEVLIDSKDFNTPVSIYMDNDLDGILSEKTDKMIGIITHQKQWTSILPIDLYPGAITYKRDRKAIKNGNIRVKSSPANYLFFLKGIKHKINSITFRGKSLVTNSLVSSLLGKPLTKLPEIARGGKKGIGAGITNLHSWLNKKSNQKTLKIGPGNVTYKNSAIFSSFEKVIILPGTNIKMEKNASLIFLGKVEFRGTSHNPILISKGNHNEEWGGIAIQGPATKGSILKNIQITGGTGPIWKMVKYPAILNIHDTSDIMIKDISIDKQIIAQDQLHLAYVDNWIIEKCVFNNSLSDAIDIEFSDGILRSCNINNTSEDGIDIMGSTITIQDCILINCNDNGISAGQRSNVTMRNSLIASSGIGALSKSSSTLKMAGSLFYKNQKSIKIETREVLYAGSAKIETDKLFSIKNKIDIEATQEAKEDILRIIRKYPTDNSLAHLLLNVIKVKDWKMFREKIDKIIRISE